MDKKSIVTLSEISNTICYGYTASASISPVGSKFLRITDITSQRVDWDNVPYCTITEKDSLKYKLYHGDILIARTGATTGCNYMMDKNEDAVFASYLIRYQINKNKALPEFVKYSLKTETWRGFVNGIVGGSAQPGANAKQFGSYEFLLPPLPEQKAIASILLSLDNKIDLLHRQNETLEAMAETLFKEWFVLNAKEEWEEKPLDEIATYLNGLACQKFPPKNDLNKLPVLKIKDLQSGISEKSDWASTDIREEYLVKNGDVIFSWSASLIVKIWNGDDCILNQHLFKVTSKSYPKWFYYLWTKQYLDEFIAVAKSHATTMGHIKRSDLKQAIVKVPTKKEIAIMDEYFSPILDKTITNHKQINILNKLRDTLLPKLMSGEVRINH